MSIPRSPFSKYLTTSDLDKRWQIYCVDSGCTEVKSGIAYPPRPETHPPQYSSHWERGRVLREFQLIYITKGGGLFKTVDTSPRPITAGTVFMLFPGIWHWFAPSAKTGWDEYWVGFDGSYPYAMMEEGFFTPKEPIFPVGLHDSLLQHFLDIIDLVTREPPGYQLQAGAAVVQIMATILAIRRQNRQSSEAEQVVQKARFIFEDYTGLPPYQYFLQIKINKAKTLLQEQRYTVKEVAHMLAFENQYYFSRLFKRKTGIAPSLWQSERAIS